MLIDKGELWNNMRLIDADKLRKDVLDLPNCYEGFSDSYDKAMIVDIADEQPTVDAVPVVRCKDCKYSHYNKAYNIQGFPIIGNSVCDKWANGCRTDENGYCFLGERRNDDETH